eukprot:TRINITY_DN3344_c0_g1_i11.p1 TRINITY_DN3344_c0_g1~~TRINITY_DN3344_c0_g1_i11.p1  ORF type:complete len:374 (-),score=74.60 TRINITY_DN3344_c0_g1_i11:1010-2131(-)
MPARLPPHFRWGQAWLDRWAACYLLNTAAADPLVYTKWLAHVEEQSREGRRLWCMLLWGLYFAVAGLWDWVLLYLVVVVCPLALLTASSDRFERFYWINHVTLYMWLTLAVTVPNQVHYEVAASAAAGCTARPWAFDPDDTRFFFGLFWLTTYLEVSVARFSAIVLHHGFIHLLVRATLGPTKLAPMCTMVMLVVFCARRRWRSGATDKMQAQIAQDQLQQSRAEMKALEDLSEVKSEFLRTLCHELRNPLSAVLGNCEMVGLKADKLGGMSLQPEVKREVDTMQRFSDNALLSMKHVLEVLNNTLKMSRLEEDQGIIVCQEDELEFREVLDTVHAMFETTAQCKGIELKMEIQESLVCGAAGLVSAGRRGLS